VRWTVKPGEAGQALARFVRDHAGERPWSEVKRWIGSGKVFVDGAAVAGEGERLRAGQAVELRMAAPRRRATPSVRIVHEDAQVVIVDKPAGVSSVPYHAGEGGTAMDLVRDAWRRMGRPATSTPLHVVHRIDKETSGLLCFAKTKRAEIAIAAQLRAHDVERLYVCVANGAVRPARIESMLVEDRGDGLRGSTTHARQGKRAVTHVEPVEALRRATLCHVRLETGKTHQIRIHLAESGHPLVGEKVYVRDAHARGMTLVAAPRLMLHAATLGFLHPTTGERLALEAPPPEDFVTVVEGLRPRSRRP
jgi:23S rRNA pseudouridine1911/1915/1917 synthase